MNLKFDTVFLSKIRINDSEFTYSEKGKSGTIPISRIEAFEVVEGTLTEQGYLKVIAAGQEHIVHFISNHNKGLRQLQERLGFSNQTEPLSVKEIEADYYQPLEAGLLKIQIKDDGIVYKAIGKDMFIKASRIKFVDFKPAKSLSLGILAIHMATEIIEIRIPDSFNKALGKWQSDIEKGIYTIGNKKNSIIKTTSNTVNVINSNNLQTPDSTFGNWNNNIHLEYEQVDRILKSKGVLDSIITIDESVPTARIQGSEVEPYITTLNECTCMDFMRRGMPCKHIYALALATGNMCWMPEYKSRGSAFNIEVEIEKYKILYRHGDIKAEAYVKICSAIAKAKKTSKR